MPCPLTHSEVAATVTRLANQFDSYDFIERCPNSGGTRDAKACPVVAAAGTRAACGRRLSAFAGAGGGIERTGVSSRGATWVRAVVVGAPAGVAAAVVGAAGATEGAAGAAAATTVPRAGVAGAAAGAAGGAAAPVGPRRPTVPTLPTAPTGFPAGMRARQVAWKQSVAGFDRCGLHKGVPADFLFPEDRWTDNIVSDFRDAVAAHLERLGIARHEYLHHVSSSQAFALNLAAPFFESPRALTPVLVGLLPPALAETVEEVVRVEAEVDGGPANYFREIGTRGANRTSADLGVWWRDRNGRENLVLVEVKFTEQAFGGCKKGSQTEGACDADGAGLVRTNGAACPLAAPPFHRQYWQRMAQHSLFDSTRLVQRGACPFRHGGYQLMRNQLLAAALEADPVQRLARVDFAVLHHDENPSIRVLDAPIGGGRDLATAWPRVLRRPDRFHVWSASKWLTLAEDGDFAGWAAEVRGRYFEEAMEGVQAAVERGMQPASGPA